MTRTGSCLCGKVHYTLEGEPFLTGVCHRADCRKDFEPAEGKIAPVERF